MTRKKSMSIIQIMVGYILIRNLISLSNQKVSKLLKRSIRFLSKQTIILTFFYIRLEEFIEDQLIDEKKESIKKIITLLKKLGIDHKIDVLDDFNFVVEFEIEDFGNGYVDDYKVSIKDRYTVIESALHQLQALDIEKEKINQEIQKAKDIFDSMTPEQKDLMKKYKNGDETAVWAIPFIF